MKNKKINSKTKIEKIVKYITVLLIAIFTILFFSGSVYAERTYNVNKNFKGEVDKWNNIFLDWNNKRIKRHNEYYNHRFQEVALFCERSLCWEENLNAFIVKSNGKSMNLEKNGQVDISFIDNGDRWKNNSNGKDIKWESSFGSSWNSVDFTKILIYKNNIGDKWTTNDFGKGILYNGFGGKQIEVGNVSATSTQNDSNFESKSAYNNESSGDQELDSTLMSIRIPKIILNQNNKYTLTFEQYDVLKNKNKTSSVYRKLFELRSPDNDAIWQGFTFQGISVDENNKAVLRLSGNWKQPQNLDSSYFKREIEAAAFQDLSIKKLDVLVNGQVFDWCLDKTKVLQCDTEESLWKVNK